MFDLSFSPNKGGQLVSTVEDVIYQWEGQRVNPWLLQPTC